MISSSFFFSSSSIAVDVLVRQLLNALLGAALLVVADVAVSDELLEVVHHVTSNVANRDAALLGQMADDLDELLAALLGELGNRQPDDLAVVRGVQPEVGLQDRPLDRLHRARVERLDREQARLGDVDRRELLDRRLLAVVVDRDPVEEGGGRRGRFERC